MFEKEKMMISDDTARSMGAKFLRENDAEDIADKLETGDCYDPGPLYCLDDAFEAAIKQFKKKGVKELLRRMPQQLRKYFYYECLGQPAFPTNLFTALDDLWYERPETNSNPYRPERLKGFDSWMAKAEKTIMRYLDGKI